MLSSCLAQPQTGVKHSSSSVSIKRVLSGVNWISSMVKHLDISLAIDYIPWGSPSMTKAVLVFLHIILIHSVLDSVSYSLCLTAYAIFRDASSAFLTN